MNPSSCAPMRRSTSGSTFRYVAVAPVQFRARAASRARTTPARRPAFVHPHQRHVAPAAGERQPDGGRLRCDGPLTGPSEVGVDVLPATVDPGPDGTQVLARLQVPLRCHEDIAALTAQRGDLHLRPVLSACARASSSVSGTFSEPAEPLCPSCTLGAPWGFGRTPSDAAAVPGSSPTPSTELMAIAMVPPTPRIRARVLIFNSPASYKTYELPKVGRNLTHAHNFGPGRSTPVGPTAQSSGHGMSGSPQLALRPLGQAPSPIVQRHFL